MTTRLRTLLVAGVVLLSGCAASGGAGTAGVSGSTEGGTSGGAGEGDLRVVASFYPLQWIAERVSGPDARVASLTKPGVEPHDVDLAPRDVEQVASADLVVHLQGFQPAVDAVVRQEAGGRGFDVSATADISLAYTPIESGKPVGDGARVSDPHFWLDPVRLAAVAEGLANRLAILDPGRGSRYRSNASALHAELERLDRDYRAGLASCASRDLVTSHAAFGYLAQRYGLTQVGITGLAPEGEPKPADLTRIADYVSRRQVKTIYYETLASPAVARTVASETGAATALLDPIEGLTAQSRGRDYLEVMRSNLATLRKGQPCR